ncbi:MAG: cobalamin B12-binding domain-containing protein [Promethearchaeota archaeon]|jgi:5-methyltetrahydrofolate--homocysteine methyltransferase
MASQLTKNLIELEHDKVLAEVEERLTQGEDPMKIFEECSMGMEVVGEKYKNKEYFLAELMLSGELFREAMELIEPYLGEKKQQGDIKGKILLVTVQGDIHDLGKNILGTLLKLEGFEVYDLGVDVNPGIVVEKVKEIQPDFLGFSALLTITFDPMRDIIEKLKEAGLRDKLKIMVGGGITTPLVKDYIGADFQTLDAMEGVQYCLEMIKARVMVKARGGI